MVVSEYEMPWMWGRLKFKSLKVLGLENSLGTEHLPMKTEEGKSIWYRKAYCEHGQPYCNAVEYWYVRIEYICDICKIHGEECKWVSGKI